MSPHQASGLRQWAKGEAARMPGVVGLVSGKGGVGKSILAVNLAVAAASRGARVLLIDGDVGLANADLLMGLVPRCDLQDWVEHRVALEQTLCRGPQGLSLLLTGESEAAAQALRRALQGEGELELSRLIAGHDLTVLDLGAGIGECVLDLAAGCRPLWLVANPEPTSLADAYSTVKRLWQRDPELEVELIVNRVRSVSAGERTHLSLSRLTRRFLGRSLSLRGVVPEEPAWSRSVVEQTPLVLRCPRSAASRRLVLLAESLLEAREPVFALPRSDVSR